MCVWCSARASRLDALSRALRGADRGVLKPAHKLQEHCRSARPVSPGYGHPPTPAHSHTHPCCPASVRWPWQARRAAPRCAQCAASGPKRSRRVPPAARRATAHFTHTHTRPQPHAPCPARGASRKEPAAETACCSRTRPRSSPPAARHAAPRHVMTARHAARAPHKRPEDGGGAGHKVARLQLAAHGAECRTSSLVRVRSGSDCDGAGHSPDGHDPVHGPHAAVHRVRLVRPQ
jgi:hypothetical protein